MLNQPDKTITINPLDQVTPLLIISLALQGAAVVLALRLIPLSGRGLAWILLSTAFLLMFARRGISLLHSEGYIASEWEHAMATEMVALAISLLIVVGVYLISGIFRERRQQSDKFERLALHDLLTELPNRAMLLRRIPELLRDAKKTGHDSLALLIMDLDQFKEVNDTLGHRTGDKVLREVARRIAPVRPKGAILARLGGDEFALAMPNAAARDAHDIAQRLRATLSAPVDVEPYRFDIGISIGIALSPRDGLDAETLLQRADVAMYMAKQLNSGIEFYDLSQDTHSVERLALTSELRRAIEENELRLYFQPVFDLKTGRANGAEALVRWEHPQRGMLLPDTFVPLAEQSGLIKPLTDWVLRTALARMEIWQRAGLALYVAVNVSVRNLQDLRLSTLLSELLLQHNLASRWLTLEITESAIMTDWPRARETLRRLDELGLGIVIDDFGTGYSSMAYLKQRPVRAVKIDKSFVCNMAEAENDAVIVRSTIDLAHNLGLRAVAEGVENRDVLDLLMILGCDAAQGFCLAHPMPAEEIEKFVRTWNATTDETFASIPRDAEAQLRN